MFEPAMGFSYDPASQVTNILHRLTATSMPINKADYVYNPVGNRTVGHVDPSDQSFAYDQLDRLTSASHPLLLDPQAFAYDAVGNRTTNGSVVNTGNQLALDANFAYQYDDNGNLTRREKRPRLFGQHVSIHSVAPRKLLTTWPSVVLLDG
ncbi:MAG: hypothetical protein V9G17_18495 [Nitrospira sp.]|nr:hypothetical protein [Nitrospira sp.]HQY57675.1 hypothetical protein [Nitrospira sp.]HRA97299.1 hypothetical protein [Nitrospira sp.]